MSYDKQQADLGNAQGEQARKNMRVAAMVRVTAFDADAMTVDLQPINKQTIDGESASAPPLVAIPVATLACGKYTIRPWYERGDVGMVIYADEDNDAAIEGGGREVEPNTGRNHAPEDGFFVGGIGAKGKLPTGLPNNALVLAVGGSYLAVGSGGIAIGGDVTIAGTLTAGGIDINNHTHGGVEPGGGTTGGPQ